MKKTILQYIFLAFLLYSDFCSGQWIRQNQFTFKGCVNDIIQYNLQKIIAVGDSGQVLISFNGCTTIENVNPGINSNFKSLSFFSEQTGFACGSNGVIIKTTNGGSNWIQLNTLGATETFYGIQAINNNTIIAVGEIGKILKSTNGGTNWVMKNNDLNCYLLSVRFFNQNTGVAVGWPGRILRTTNGGDNWYRIYHNMNYTAQITSIDSKNNIAYLVGDSMLIARSTDYGNSWIRVDTSNGPTTAPFYKVKIVDSLKVIATGDNYRLSTDGGQNFSFYGAWLYYGSNISATKGMAINTFDTGFVCGNKGIGTPFYYLGSLYLIDVPYNIYDLHELSVIDANNCWVLGRGFFAHNLPHIIYKTTNSGINWVFQNIYNTIPNTLITVLFFNSNTGYISGDDGGYGFILKTTDNGINWIQTCYGNAGQFSSTLKKYGNRLYTTNNYGYIIYTTNDGQNWTNITTPPLTSVSNYSIADSNTYFGYNSNSSNNIFKSTNSGLNWIFLTNPLTGIDWRDIIFINKNTGYIIGNKSSVLKTTNGNSFTPLQSGFLNSNLVFNSIFSSDSLNLYLVGDSGIIYKSSNGGLNWISQNSGLKDKLLKVRFFNNNTGWIIGWNGVILHTSNGGTVWVSHNTIEVNNYSLFQNYPNPFNPTTNIKYQIESIMFIKLVVYDVLGKEVATLVNKKQSPGTYEVTFDGSGLSSGIYFYKLEAGDFSEVKKMLMIK